MLCLASKSYLVATWTGPKLIVKNENWPPARVFLEKALMINYKLTFPGLNGSCDFIPWKILVVKQGFCLEVSQILKHYSKEKWSYHQAMIANKYYLITGQTRQDEINCSKTCRKFRELTVYSYNLIADFQYLVLRC